MIHHTLTLIRGTLAVLVATDDWTAQQQPFLAHMTKTCQHLLAQTVDLPTSETHLYSVLAVFDATFDKQLSVVYGYAKMLLDSPQSFGGVAVTDAQRALLTDVFGFGMALATWLKEAPEKAQVWRTQERAKPAVTHSLTDILAAQLPLLYYVARRCDLRIEAQEHTLATFRPYHLAAFVFYVVRAMADALREATHPAPVIHLTIASIAQGTQLALECPAMLDLDVLFARHGGAHYLRALFDDDAGYFPHTEAGFTRLVVRLPHPTSQ